ncbi:MAG: NYN domain-containing protein, partial [Candidatus Poribacteria bacterium]
MLQIYNKIQHLIDEEKLAFILKHGFAQQDIISLMNRCGIEYDGMRITDIPIEHLVSDLAEYFFKEFDTGRLIIKDLEKHSINAYNRVHDMTLEEIQTFFSNTAQLVKDNEFGPIVWSLLMDERVEVNNHAHQLLESYDEYIHQQESKEYKELEELETLFEQLDEAGDEDIYGEQYTAEEVAALEDKIADLQVELKEKLKDIEHRIRTEKRLNEKNEKLLEQIEILKKSCSQFACEKGELRHQIKELEAENLRLRRVKRDVNNNGKESNQHQLERENKKLKYDLQKALQGLAELDELKIERAKLEVELKSIAEEFQEYKIAKAEEIESLQRDLQKQREESALALKSAHKRIKELTPSQVEENPPRNDSEKQRVGVFVDVQNMFYAAKDRYNARLDYLKLLDMIVGDRTVIAAIAYVVQMPEVDQTAFISFLEHNGYHVKSKELRMRLDGSAKGDWDMGIAIDIISMLNDLDVVILASGDGDFCALVEMVKEKGCRVEIVAFPHNTSI